MTTFFTRALLIALTSTLLAPAAPSTPDAHSGAKGVTKERMELMKGLADAMKAMGAMFKGEAPFEVAVVVDKAGRLADHARKIPAMTPEGSNEHPSEALPAIWESWDDYVAKATELADESAGLNDLAGNGADEPAIRAQFLKVGKTCGACHDRFRKPKEGEG